MSYIFRVFTSHNLTKLKCLAGTDDKTICISNAVIVSLVGNDGDIARLELDINAMRFKSDQPQFPMSFCSDPCRPGQAKLQLEGDTCCWLCTNCSSYQYLADEFHCEDCPLGENSWNSQLIENNWLLLHKISSIAKQI